MAKAPAADGIMTPEKMKPLLALSKHEPVQAAIGLTADGDGVMLLDKKAKPKKVFGMLKANAAKARLNLNSSSLRFGRAEVDSEYDSGCVRLFINKDAPGALRVKLTELVKRIPYQKVEINVDASLEHEPEEESEAEEAAPTVAQAGPDSDELKQRLTTLAQRIPGVLASDPARRDTLLTLAKQSQTLLAQNDVPALLEALTALEHTLDAPIEASTAAGNGAPIEASAAAVSGAPIEASAAAGNGAPGRYDKARQAWLAVRRQMEGELEKLRQEMLDFYEDADIAGTLNRGFNEVVEPVLSTLDDSLAHALDDATKATDAAQQAASLAEARTIIGRYQAYLGSEPLFREIDGNPFVRLSVATTMTKALATLAQAVG